jgi:plasmid stabilization system protein ParE
MNPLPVKLQPQAEQDARFARRWYSARNPEAGERFMAELDRAILAIGESPERWAPYLHNTRRLHLRRFPYWLIYRLDADLVLVLAVAHDRRHPDYWRRRLQTRP